MLAIDLRMMESKIAQYEVIEDGKTYREWLIPAKQINEKAAVRIIDEG